MIKIKLIAVLFLALCMSCVDDNSSLNPHPINEVTITGMKEEYTVYQFDSLKIPINISTLFKQTENLEYTWYMYTENSAYVADTLAFTQNLAVQIYAIPGNDYTLTYKVTDKISGVFYKQSAKLKVLDQFTEGTLILAEDNGRAQLNFLERTGDLLTDVYTNTNGEAAGINPRRVYSVNPNPAAPALKEVYIFCQDQNGGALIDPITFKRRVWLRDAFFVTPTADQLNATAWSMTGSADYMIINGNAVNRATNMGEVRWKQELVLLTDPNDVNLSPCIYNTGSFVAFYDNLHQRFLHHASFNKGALQIFTQGKKDFFDYDNVGMNLIHGDRYDSNCFFGLFEDNNNNLFILTAAIALRFNYGEMNTLGKTALTGSLATGLKESPCYATSADQFSGFLFYAIGSDVYVYNLETNSSAFLCNAGSRTDIDHMEIFDTQLRLGIRDNSVEGKKGGYIFFGLTTEGGLKATELDRKVGFCDKVVDFDEKLN